MKHSGTERGNLTEGHSWKDKPKNTDT